MAAETIATDVLVIGSGSAGAAFARSTVGGGVRVLMADARPQLSTRPARNTCASGSACHQTSATPDAAGPGERTGLSRYPRLEVVHVAGTESEVLTRQDSEHRRALLPSGSPLAYVPRLPGAIEHNL